MKRSLHFRLSLLLLALVLLLGCVGIAAGAADGNFDNNGDGKVDISDVTATLNYLAGSLTGEESVFDDNGDGKVDISDVTALLNALAGGCSHVNVVTDPATDPTCTEPGLSEGSHCADCGEILTAQEVTAPALGHDYSLETGICTRCHELVCTPGLSFSVDNSHRTATVTGYTGSAAEVVIPDAYNGYPVVSIGNNAFYENAVISSVTLPDSLTQIGRAAFSGCNGLTSVVVPEGVKTVETDAFAYCGNLHTITLPKSLERIGQGMDFASPISDVYFAGTEDLWNNSVSIGTFNFMSSETVFHFECFCTDGHTVTDMPDVPATCSKPALVGGSSCALCGKVFVEQTESGFSLGHDADYDSYCRRCGKLASTPGLLFTERDGHFAVTGYGGSSLDVIIPNSFLGLPVAEIGRVAFEGCNLNSVYVPISVEQFSPYAFYAARITTTYYRGTKEQWDALSVYAAGTVIFECTCFEGEHEVVIDHATAVTCDTPALSEGSHCSVCGTVLTAQKVTAEALGHNYVNGVCTRCGGTPFTAGLSFALVDGTYTVVGYEGSDSYVRIPALYAGLPVTAIAEDAFRLKNAVRSIIVPESVTFIDAQAFNNSEALECVLFPKSLTTLGHFAFIGCSGLKTVYYAGSAEDWTEVSVGVDFGELTDATFVYNFTDEHAYVTDPAVAPTCTEPGLTEGSHCCLCGDVAVAQTEIAALGHVYVDNVCTRCGFENHSEGLTFTQMPGYFVVNGYVGTDRIVNVAATYDGKTVTGVFYAFKGNTDILTVNLPSTVEVFTSEAFRGCTALQRFVVPEGVNDILDRMFEGCTSLRSIVIPTSVTRIACNAFDNCTSLTDIYYAGTEEQWNSIIFDPMSEYEPFAAVVHFNYVPDGCLHIEVEVPDVAPTCTEAGRTHSYKCVLCDALVHSEAVPKLGHRFVDGVCSRCGETTVSVGDTIVFGSYEQDGITGNGKEPLEWLVLAINDGKATLITKKVVDALVFNSSTGDGSEWDECTLRAWLNGDFCNAAFTADESAYVLTTVISDPIHTFSFMDYETEDKVFVLSPDEANALFASDDARIAQPTAYAMTKGLDVRSRMVSEGVSIDVCEWWLRVPGEETGDGTFVEYAGRVNTKGNPINRANGVRPAITFDLASYCGTND